MNAASLGKIISKLRKKQGLTQLDLANKLCVTDKAVSRWESGAGFPEITQLPALSETFGVSIDYLIKGNSRGIVVAGNILADVVNTIDSYPSKGMLTNITETVNAVGGCVPNTAINLAKIDQELFVSALGRVGDDELGRYVVAQMRKFGIDTSSIAISPEKPTSYSSVMAERDTGERTFFHMRGANAEFSADDIDLDELDCEIFHAGYILLLDELDKPDDTYGTKMAKLLHDVGKKGIKTSIDVVSEEGDRFKEKVIPCLKYCDYTIMNEYESSMVTGLSPRTEDGRVNVENIKETMRKFIEYGVREKVIVHCREAGFLMSSDGNFVCVPSLILPKGFVKGNVGAGDAYAAGSLYGIYSGYDDRKILEFASATAACSLSKPDSISGMKSKEKIFELEQASKRMSMEEI